MASSDAPSGTLGKRPGPSDPSCVATAAPRKDRPVTTRIRLPYGAQAPVGPLSWVALEPKLELALEAGGFAVMLRAPPRYTPDPWGTSDLTPGAALFVGEAQLVRLPHNVWLTAASYSSVIARVTCSATPPPTKKDLGRPDQATSWSVVAEVGAVESYDGAASHSAIRSFVKTLPTDPALEWLPSAILSSLSE